MRGFEFLSLSFEGAFAPSTDIMGRVSNKVLQLAKEMAVWVVG